MAGVRGARGTGGPRAPGPRLHPRPHHPQHRRRAMSAPERLRAENDRLRPLDAQAAPYVETGICMRTHITGEPPYVGWKGLGLALREALDERDRLRAEREEVEQLRRRMLNG